MSLFSTLHVGASGLRVAQLQIGNASQNLTNAATPGYTRRSVVQEPVPGPPAGGLGVRAHGPTRVIDRFIERRLLGSTSDRAEAESRAAALGVLDQVLAEGTGTLGDSIRAFESSLRDLSANPSDLTLRTQVLGTADAMARAFNAAGRMLDDTRTEIDGRIEDGVEAVNTLTSQIAALSREIKKAEVSGEQAPDLRDQRDQKIRELSEHVPIDVIEHADGGVSVLLGGRQALVTEDGRSRDLRAVPDAAAGTMTITMNASGVTEDVSADIGAGTIGGLLDARGRGLAQAEQALDELAFDLASAYDAVHVAGFGLDGAGGRHLFTPLAGAAGAAIGLSVSSDVAGQPANVAAATDPTLVPGDNRNALAMIALERSPIALGGTASSAEALAALVRAGAGALASAESDVERQSALEDQTNALRESVSGVSSDEEMVALMQHQRAYQASLRVVQVADDLLGELMNMAR